MENDKKCVKQKKRQAERNKRLQEKKKRIEQRKKDFQKNREIYIITGVMALFFIAMGIYYMYYIVAVSDDAINNSYNPRISSMQENVNRGSILSSNGTVLAETVLENGKTIRKYPFGELFAHPVGYSTMNTTGLERVLNFSLLSSHESLIQKIYYDIMERRYEGDSIYTTLDADLQKFVWNAMGDYKGAVIVIEPSTGKILSMVSKPGYNPNTLKEDWNNLVSPENTSANLLNRATQGTYPPGSTFKILTILEYIRENPDTWQDVTFECDGAFEYGDGLVLHCHDGHAHGTMTIATGLAESCNGIHAWLGLSLDRKKFVELCESFGFNRSLPIKVGSSTSKISIDETTSDWAMMLASIGLGPITETPLQNVLITSAIANDGVMMKPMLFDAVVNEQWDVIKEYKTEKYLTPMTKEEAAILTELMEGTIRAGSGSAGGSEYFSVAGKTGSADYDSKGNRHAWFTAFAPAENPQIAISIVLEDGQLGGTYAAPIAKAIFEYYLLKERQ